MAKTEKFTKKQIITALAKAGTISGAATLLKCNRATVSEYLKKYPECKDAMEEAREKLIDVAESRLMKNVDSGHPSSVFFVLKTIGKNRGYVERQEVTGKDGEAIKYEAHEVQEFDDRVLDVFERIKAGKVSKKPKRRGKAKAET